MEKEWIKRRLQGELPRIQIDGDDYIIDWRLKELRHPSDFGKNIDLRRLDMNDEGTEYVCLYNTRNHEVVYDLQGDENVEDLSALHIPYEMKLDPVAVAREYGLKDTELLDEFPSVKHQNAHIRPLDQWQIEFTKKQLQKIMPTRQNVQKRGRGMRF